MSTAGVKPNRLRKGVYAPLKGVCAKPVCVTVEPRLHPAMCFQNSQFLEAHLGWPRVAGFSDVMGGLTLPTHHAFVVAYALQKDLGLSFHVDSSDVTLNVCLVREGLGPLVDSLGTLSASSELPLLLQYLTSAPIPAFAGQAV